MVKLWRFFMLTLGPLDPTTAKPLEIDRILHEHGNRALPYVFPRAKGGLVSNPANRILLERKPEQSAREQFRSIKEQNLDIVLGSHGIPGEAYKALMKNDARNFIEARAQHLAQLEWEFMKKMGVPLPTETDFGEADIDTDEV